MMWWPANLMSTVMSRPSPLLQSQLHAALPLSPSGGFCGCRCPHCGRGGRGGRCQLARHKAGRAVWMWEQPRRHRHWRRGGWGPTLGWRWVPVRGTAAARRSLFLAVLVAARQHWQHLLQPHLRAGAWLQTCQCAIPHCPPPAASAIATTPSWGTASPTQSVGAVSTWFRRGAAMPAAAVPGPQRRGVVGMPSLGVKRAAGTAIASNSNGMMSHDICGLGLYAAGGGQG